MEYRSHTDKLLRDHLYEVAQVAKANVINAGRKDLVDFALIEGGLHDVGKYTDFFQRALATGNKINCSDHALISSLITFNETYRRTSDKLHSILTMLSVYSHHGYLKGVTYLYTKLLTLENEIDYNDSCIKRQYENLAGKWGSVIKNELSWLDPQNLPSLEDLVKQSKSAALDIKKKDRYTWKEYFDGLMLFSSLIDADKHSASDTSIASTALPKPEFIINFTKDLPRYGNEIDKMREQLFSWAKNFVNDKEIFALVAPTGSGKTLSGTLIGLRSGKNRLIYSLPFISIIEQTGTTLSDALGKDNILTYHHMSFNWQPDEEDIEKKLILAESWQHPVVVTTFEAFVASFLSNRNSYLKRLHNIANSFLILDEVQALPVERISLVMRAIDEMKKQLNVSVLLMSATMPLVTGDVKRPISTEPNRYKISFNQMQSFKSPQELASLIDFSKGSIMIELNTIASAEQVYDSLKEHTPYYLSTRIIPKERHRIIEEIKEKLHKGEKVVLVTTQVVEAGVNLDFALAYRDLGPIDSIVQAAGRVNRNYRSYGELSVYRIKRKGGTDFSKVYGQITENITLETLNELYHESQNISVRENEINKILDVYFKKVEQYLRPEESRISGSDLENILKLEFDKVNVKLIKNEPKYTVFVEFDDNAKEIWNGLHNVLNGNVYEDKARIKILMSNAQQYVVNLWDELDLENDTKLGWYYLPFDKVKSYYHKNLGIRTPVKDNTSEALLW